MGRVEVGLFDLRLRPKAGAGFDFAALDGELWRQSGRIKQNEEQQLEVTINTGIRVSSTTGEFTMTGLPRGVVGSFPAERALPGEERTTSRRGERRRTG